MTCTDIEARLHPYVDGELPVSETATVDAHLAGCPACAALARRERDFRALLRRQPRERAPEEFRRALVARIRRQARRRAARPWVWAPSLAAAAVLLAIAMLPARQTAPSLMVDLVDKHIAYAQLDRPAELVSSDPAEVAAWFLQRAGLRVTVPDYSPAGIRLVGGRLAEAHERKAAYLLYEKGSVLLSVFVVPTGEEPAPLRGDQVNFRGHPYVKSERKGFRTVAWTENRILFGLVSSLDYDALLECADHLRYARARQVRL
jgi:mycothiol system anti-sigma-R factor